ncbi:MAG: CpsD/CapB family tyrosine-protein kinase, partial [Planctomycetaceae bacterium]
LLIDADLRRPGLHGLFGARGEIGLADALAGEIDLLSALQPVTAGRGEIAGLSLLSAGAPPEDPAELLTSPRLGELLERARQEFDFVLIDTPPLLAVSDPCTIAPQVDGLLLVVRLEKTRHEALERSVELLRRHYAPVLGVVVNGVTGDAGFYGDGYGDASLRDELRATPRQPAMAT